MDKERLEQEIECMLKYVTTLEGAKGLLEYKERLLARVMDDNKWLERDYYEIEEENEKLKSQLKKSLESNNDLLKQIMELEAQLIKERLKGKGEINE